MDSLQVWEGLQDMVNSHKDMVSHPVWEDLQDMVSHQATVNSHQLMVSLQVTVNNLKVMDNHQVTVNNLKDMANNHQPMGNNLKDMANNHQPMANNLNLAMANSLNLAMEPHKVVVRNTAIATLAIQCNGQTRFHNHTETREWIKLNVISAVKRSTMLTGTITVNLADPIFVRIAVVQG